MKGGCPSNGELTHLPFKRCSLHFVPTQAVHSLRGIALLMEAGETVQPTPGDLLPSLAMSASNRKSIGGHVTLSFQGGKTTDLTSFEGQEGIVAPHLVSVAMPTNGL